MEACSQKDLISCYLISLALVLSIYFYNELQKEGGKVPGKAPQDFTASPCGFRAPCRREFLEERWRSFIDDRDRGSHAETALCSRIRGDYIGQMLWHSSLRSTELMAAQSEESFGGGKAKYIAAKDDSRRWKAEAQCQGAVPAEHHSASPRSKMTMREKD